MTSVRRVTFGLLLCCLPVAAQAQIRGIWEPGAYRELGRLADSSAGLKRLRALGLNTISVVASFRIDDRGRHVFYGKRESVEDIQRYKKHGFSVFLCTSTRSDARAGQTREAALKSYLDVCGVAALEVARMAADHGADYFSPANELEGALQSDVLPARLTSTVAPESPMSKPDAATNRRVELASRWHRELLPKIRKIYKGKLMAKVGQAHPGYRVKGYDYLGFTIDHQYLKQAPFRALVRQNYLHIAQAAKQSGCRWLVGEAYFHHGEPDLQLEAEQSKFLKQMQPYYFHISLEEYLALKGKHRPVGYIFIGYLMRGIEVQGSPSETVLRKYFKRMKKRR